VSLISLQSASKLKKIGSDLNNNDKKKTKKRNKAKNGWKQMTG